jgi:CheY-like chemotaxis protein
VLVHELRNPLAPIRNAVELLGKKGLSERAREAMRLTIDRQSIHLMKIIEDLVDISRIAHGKFTVQKNELDLRDVLAQAVETSRPVIDARGHELQVRIPDEALPLHGDAFRLIQAVANLLNNAAKYTPSGGRISLDAERSGPNVEIRVRDTGRGLQRDEFEQIFEPFAQAAADQGGLGIGLALVRKIVELHDGDVEPHSEGPGKGSEFVVRLPMPIPSEARESDAEALADRVPGSLKILIVDDNKDATDSMQMLLEIMGHEVRTAYDGRAGVLTAAELEPDVVLLDIDLPALSGYEVAKALRSGGGRNAVLVAITGWGQESDKRKAREAGFDYHLVKPISEKILRPLLEEIAARIAARAAAEPSGT